MYTTQRTELQNVWNPTRASQGLCYPLCACKKETFPSPDGIIEISRCGVDKEALWVTAKKFLRAHQLSSLPTTLFHSGPLLTLVLSSRLSFYFTLPPVLLVGHVTGIYAQPPGQGTRRNPRRRRGFSGYPKSELADNKTPPELQGDEE